MPPSSSSVRRSRSHSCAGSTAASQSTTLPSMLNSNASNAPSTAVNTTSATQIGPQPARAVPQESPGNRAAAKPTRPRDRGRPVVRDGPATQELQPCQVGRDAILRRHGHSAIARFRRAKTRSVAERGPPRTLYSGFLRPVSALRAWRMPAARAPAPSAMGHRHRGVPTRARRNAGPHPRE